MNDWSHGHSELSHGNKKPLLLTTAQIEQLYRDAGKTGPLTGDLPLHEFTGRARTEIIYNCTIRLIAQNEIRQAAFILKQLESNKLHTVFQEDLQAVIEEIQESPLTFPLALGPIRRAQFPHSTYCIYFTVNELDVEILRFFGASEI